MIRLLADYKEKNLTWLAPLASEAGIDVDALVLQLCQGKVTVDDKQTITNPGAIKLPTQDEAQALVAAAPKGAPSKLPSDPTVVHASALAPPPKSLEGKDIPAQAGKARAALDDDPTHFPKVVASLTKPAERAAVFDTMLANADEAQLKAVEAQAAKIPSHDLQHEMLTAVKLRRAQMPGGVLAGIATPEVVSAYRALVGSKNGDTWMQELGLSDADLRALLTAPPGTPLPPALEKAMTAVQQGGGKTFLVAEFNTLQKLFPLYRAAMEARAKVDAPNAEALTKQAAAIETFEKKLGGFAQANRIAWAHRMEGEAGYQEKLAAQHDAKAKAAEEKGDTTGAAAERKGADTCRANAKRQREAGATQLAAEAQGVDQQIVKMGDKAPQAVRTMSTHLHAGVVSYETKLGEADAKEQIAAFEASKQKGAPTAPPDTLPANFGAQPPGENGQPAGGAKWHLDQARRMNPNAATDPAFLGAQATYATTVKDTSHTMLALTGWPPPKRDPKTSTFADAEKQPDVAPTAAQKKLRTAEVEATFILGANVGARAKQLSEKPHLTPAEQQELTGLVQQAQQLSLEQAEMQREATSQADAYPKLVLDIDKLRRSVTELDANASAATSALIDHEALGPGLKKEAEKPLASADAKKKYELWQTRHDHLLEESKSAWKARNDANRSLAVARLNTAVVSAEGDMAFATLAGIEQGYGAKDKDGFAIPPTQTQILQLGHDASAIAQKTLMPPLTAEMKPARVAAAGDVATAVATFESRAANLENGAAIMPGQAAKASTETAIAALDYAYGANAALPKGSPEQQQLSGHLAKTGSEVAAQVARIDPPRSANEITRASGVVASAAPADQPALNNYVFERALDRSVALATRDKQLGPSGLPDNELTQATALARQMRDKAPGATDAAFTAADAQLTALEEMPAKMLKAIEEGKANAIKMAKYAKADAEWNERQSQETVNGAISIIIDLSPPFAVAKDHIYRTHIEARTSAIDRALTSELAGWDNLATYTQAAIASGTFSEGMARLQYFNAPKIAGAPAHDAQVGDYMKAHGITGFPPSDLTHFMNFNPVASTFQDAKLLDPATFELAVNTWMRWTNGEQDRQVGEAQTLNQTLSQDTFFKVAPLAVAYGELVVGTILTGGAMEAVEGTAMAGRIALLMNNLRTAAAATRVGATAVEASAAFARMAPTIYRIAANFGVKAAQGYAILMAQDLANKAGGAVFSTGSLGGRAFAFSTQMIGASATNYVGRLNKFFESLLLPTLQFSADTAIDHWPDLAPEQREMLHLGVKLLVPTLGALHGAHEQNKEIRQHTESTLRSINEGLPAGARMSDAHIAQVTDRITHFAAEPKPTQAQFEAHSKELRGLVQGLPKEAGDALVQQQASIFAAKQNMPNWSEKRLPTAEEAQRVYDKMLADQLALGVPHEVASLAAQEHVAAALRAAMPAGDPTKYTPAQRAISDKLGDVGAAVQHQVATAMAVAGALKAHGAFAAMPDAAKAVMGDTAGKALEALRAEPAKTPAEMHAILDAGRAEMIAKLAPMEPAAAQVLADGATKALQQSLAEQSARGIIAIAGAGQQVPAAAKARVFEQEAQRFGIDEARTATRSKALYAEYRAMEVAGGKIADPALAAKAETAVRASLTAYKAGDNLGETAAKIEQKLTEAGVKPEVAKQMAKDAAVDLALQRALGPTGQVSKDGRLAFVQGYDKALAEIPGVTPEERAAARADAVLSGIQQDVAALAQEAQKRGPVSPQQVLEMTRQAAIEARLLFPEVNPEQRVAEAALDLATKGMLGSKEGQALLGDPKRLTEASRKLSEDAVKLGADTALVREALGKRLKLPVEPSAASLPKPAPAAAPSADAAVLLKGPRAREAKVLIDALPDVLPNGMSKGEAIGMLARMEVTLTSAPPAVRRRVQLALEHLLSTPRAANFEAVLGGIKDAEHVAQSDPQRGTQMIFEFINTAAAVREFNIANPGVDLAKMGAEYRFTNDHLPLASAWPQHAIKVGHHALPATVDPATHHADGTVEVTVHELNGTTTKKRVPQSELVALAPRDPAKPEQPQAAVSVDAAGVRENYVLKGAQVDGQQVSLVWDVTAGAFRMADASTMRPTVHNMQAAGMQGVATANEFFARASDLPGATAKLPPSERAELHSEMLGTLRMTPEAFAALPQPEQAAHWAQFLAAKHDALPRMARTAEEQMLMMQVFNDRGSFADVAHFMRLQRAYFGENPPAPEALLRWATADGFVQLCNESCGPSMLGQGAIAMSPLEGARMVARGREGMLADQLGWMQSIQSGTTTRTDGGAARAAGLGDGALPYSPEFPQSHVAAVQRGSNNVDMTNWLNGVVGPRLGASYQSDFVPSSGKGAMPAASDVARLNDGLWAAVHPAPPKEGVFAMVTWVKDVGGVPQSSTGHWVSIKGGKIGANGEHIYIVRDPWSGKTVEIPARELANPAGGSVLGDKGYISQIFTREAPEVTAVRQRLGPASEASNAFATMHRELTALAADPAQASRATQLRTSLDLVRTAPDPVLAVAILKATGFLRADPRLGQVARFAQDPALTPAQRVAALATLARVASHAVATAPNAHLVPPDLPGRSADAAARGLVTPDQAETAAAMLGYPGLRPEVREWFNREWPAAATPEKHAEILRYLAVEGEAVRAHFATGTTRPVPAAPGGMGAPATAYKPSAEYLAKLKGEYGYVVAGAKTLDPAARSVVLEVCEKDARARQIVKAHGADGARLVAEMGEAWFTQLRTATPANRSAEASEALVRLGVKDPATFKAAFAQPEAFLEVLTQARATGIDLVAVAERYGAKAALGAAQLAKTNVAGFYALLRTQGEAGAYRTMSEGGAAAADKAVVTLKASPAEAKALDMMAALSARVKSDGAGATLDSPAAVATGLAAAYTHGLEITPAMLEAHAIHELATAPAMHAPELKGTPAESPHAKGEQEGTKDEILKVTTPEGKTYFVKPVGEQNGTRPLHEAAASDVASLLGTDTIPKTEMRTLDGRLASAQEAVPAGYKQVQFGEEGLILNDPAYARALAEMQVVQYLTGNVDCQAPNVFYFKDGSGVGHLRAIDSASAFGEGIPPAKRGGTPLAGGILPGEYPPELAARLAKMTPEEVRAALGAKLSPSEMTMVLVRLEILKADLQAKGVQAKAEARPSAPAARPSTPPETAGFGGPTAATDPFSAAIEKRAQRWPAKDRDAMLAEANRAQASAVAMSVKLSEPQRRALQQTFERWLEAGAQVSAGVRARTMEAAWKMVEAQPTMPAAVLSEWTYRYARMTHEKHPALPALDAVLALPANVRVQGGAGLLVAALADTSGTGALAKRFAALPMALQGQVGKGFEQVYVAPKFVDEARAWQSDTRSDPGSVHTKKEIAHEQSEGAARQAMTGKLAALLLQQAETGQLGLPFSDPLQLGSAIKAIAQANATLGDHAAANKLFFGPPPKTPAEMHALVLLINESAERGTPYDLGIVQKHFETARSKGLTKPENSAKLRAFVASGELNFKPKASVTKEQAAYVLDRSGKPVLDAKKQPLAVDSKEGFEAARKIIKQEMELSDVPNEFPAETKENIERFFHTRVSRRALEYMFRPTVPGYSAEVVKCVCEGDRFAVEVYMRDAEGRAVGRVTREAFHAEDGHLVWHNEFMELDPSQHDAGLAKGIYAQGEAFLSLVAPEMGTEIRMRANLTVGKYAWAQAGFQFIDAAQRDAVHADFVSLLDSRLGHLSASEKADIRTAIDLCQTPQDFASLRFVDAQGKEITLTDPDVKEVKIDQTPVGKAFMLLMPSSGWDANRYPNAARAAAKTEAKPAPKAVGKTKVDDTADVDANW